MSATCQVKFSTFKHGYLVQMCCSSDSRVRFHVNTFVTRQSASPAHTWSLQCLVRSDKCFSRKAVKFPFQHKHLMSRSNHGNVNILYAQAFLSLSNSGHVRNSHRKHNVIEFKPRFLKGSHLPRPQRPFQKYWPPDRLATGTFHHNKHTQVPSSSDSQLSCCRFCRPVISCAVGRLPGDLFCVNTCFTSTGSHQQMATISPSDFKQNTGRYKYFCADHFDVCDRVFKPESHWIRALDLAPRFSWVMLSCILHMTNFSRMHAAPVISSARAFKL